jgi:ABC-type transport system involved in cytochrome bd biosynthesis fused ATPase/permease subunit
MLDKVCPVSLTFFFSELNFRKRKFFTYLIVGFFGIFAEAFGIGMIVPILDFIRLNGDVETLVSSNKFWGLANQMIMSFGFSLNLFFLLVVFVSAIFLRQIFDYSYALMMVSLKNELLHTLRGKLFFGLQSISFAKAQQQTSGEFINLLDYQTEQVSNILPTYFRLIKTCSTFLLYA